MSMLLASLVLSLSPADLKATCLENKFIVKVKPLNTLTESQMDEVSFVAQTNSVCSAIKAQFKIRGNTQVPVKIRKWDSYTILESPPCYSGDLNCHGVYKEFENENVELEIAGIPLKGVAVIPSSINVKTYYWSYNDCPPYTPSCGL